MLIEVESPHHVLLTEFDGIVLATCVRDDWERKHENYVEQGEEGVWYMSGDIELVPVLMQPFRTITELPGRLLYQLRPEPKASVQTRWRHRYLCRYWKNDTYIPRIETVIYELIEHNNSKGELTWSLQIPNITLHGVTP